MSNKQIMQTMFALCTAALLTAGCSNEAPDGDYGNSKDASVAVSYTHLTLPTILLV